MAIVHGSLKKFGALEGREKRAVMLAIVLLPASGLALRMLGIGRAVEWLRRLNIGAPRADVPTSAARTWGRAVNIAAAHGPFRAHCLTRSVLLTWLLRRRGFDARLRIGAKFAAGGMAAHAWVECEGVPVNDRHDISDEFAPFDEVAPMHAFRS